jgi:hypothetical protein
MAAASFFLPWGRFSFLFVHKSASGSTVGGWGWAIFVLASIAAAAGLILPRWRRAAPAREIVFGAALLGLLLFFLESSQLARGVWTPFGRIQPQDIGVKPGPGAFGTIIGYITAIGGSFLMPGPAPAWVRPRAWIRHSRSARTACLASPSPSPASPEPASETKAGVA